MLDVETKPGFDERIEESPLSVASVAVVAVAIALRKIVR